MTTTGAKFEFAASNDFLEAASAAAAESEQQHRHHQGQPPPLYPTIERRGGGILTTHTACRISLWIWYSTEGGSGKRKPSKKKMGQVCDDIRHHGQRIGHRLLDATLLRPNDTIFVPFTSLDDFVNAVLSQLTVDVVLISGHPFNVRPPSSTLIQQLIHHPHVVAWFCQNLPKYGGTDPYHNKVYPFPYGLNEKENKLGWMTLPAYKRVLFEGLNSTVRAALSNEDVTELDDIDEEGIHTMMLNDTRSKRYYDDNKKSIFIYAGPLKAVEAKAMAKSGVEDTSSGRKDIPGTHSKTQYKKERLVPYDYFTQIAKSRYILSPDGDRPECFRHYEALGLGSVPITELDPVLFRHLHEGPIIYNNHVWDTQVLQHTLDPYPNVNRNLIREDYWLEWVERQVGRRLTWSDRLRLPGTGNSRVDESEDDEETREDENDHREKRYNGLTDAENELLVLLDHTGHR